MNRVAVGLAGLAAIVLTVGSAHASPGAIGPSRMIVGQDAWYDDHYGPFYNGYWTAAGEFYFSTGPGRPFARDDGRHFRRVTAAGFRPVEGFAGTPAVEATASR